MNVLTIDCDWAKTHEKFLQLIRLSLDKYSTADELIFIREHHQAYPFIQKGDVLYNIDHHHDLGYENNHLTIEKQGVYGPANWVYALIYQKIIAEYHWIANIDSDYYFLDIENKMNGVKAFTRELTLDKIHPLSFKKIIICESRRYEKSAAITFDVLKAIAKNHKNVKTVDSMNSTTPIHV